MDSYSYCCITIDFFLKFFWNFWKAFIREAESWMPSMPNLRLSFFWDRIMALLSFRSGLESGISSLKIFLSLCQEASSFFLSALILFRLSLKKTRLILNMRYKLVKSSFSEPQEFESKSAYESWSLRGSVNFAFIWLLISWLLWKEASMFYLISRLGAPMF